MQTFLQVHQSFPDFFLPPPPQSPLSCAALETALEVSLASGMDDWLLSEKAHKAFCMNRSSPYGFLSTSHHEMGFTQGKLPKNLNKIFPGVLKVHYFAIQFLVFPPKYFTQGTSLYCEYMLF